VPAEVEPDGVRNVRVRTSVERVAACKLGEVPVEGDLKEARVVAVAVGWVKG
jgi:hypothetical protein